VSANYDRHYGLSPDLFIQVTHSDDVKVTHTDRLVQRMQRLMTGMDAINLDGVGSGRSPEEQVAALEAAGEVIDAEEVEDDQVDEDGRTDEDAGRWYHGKWIPAEADVDAPGLSGHSGLSRTSSGWPTTSSAA